MTNACLVARTSNKWSNKSNKWWGFDLQQAWSCTRVLQTLSGHTRYGARFDSCQKHHALSGFRVGFGTSICHRPLIQLAQQLRFASAQHECGGGSKLVIWVDHNSVLSDIPNVGLGFIPTINPPVPLK